MMRNPNLRLIALLAFCVFSLSIFVQTSFAKKKFTTKEEREVSHTMRMLQLNTENLHIAFEKRDWKEVGKLAMSIHDSCANIEARGDMDVPLEFDDFRIFSENMHDYAEKLVNASKREDIESAKVAYKGMEKTCVDCHKKFR